jgi:2-phosphoglycerate kinase
MITSIASMTFYDPNWSDTIHKSNSRAMSTIRKPSADSRSSDISADIDQVEILMDSLNKAFNRSVKENKDTTITTTHSGRSPKKVRPICSTIFANGIARSAP